MLDDDIAKLERQKNTPDGKWYGLSFIYTDMNGVEQLCDNGDWVMYTLFEWFFNKEHNTIRRELDVKWTKDTFKQIRKMFISARKLGWFTVSE